jgi:hypothetical protein
MRQTLYAFKLPYQDVTLFGYLSLLRLSAAIFLISQKKTAIYIHIFHRNLSCQILRAKA